MNLEKEIIIEKFKGMHNAFSKLIGSHSSLAKVVEELKIVNSFAKETIRNSDDLKMSFGKIAFERDKFLYALADLNESTADLSAQKEKILKVFKEKLSSVQKDLQSAVEERESLNLKLTELDKKYQDLLEEFRKFRQKIKIRYTALSKNEEKFCKNCQKSFYESENFNWSCKIHSSKLSGDIFWCCGKLGKDAPGCIVSKHQAKEENNLEEECQNSSINQKFCTSCKETGHSSLMCIKDPNLRSNCDVIEEKKRLKEIKLNNKKALANGRTLASFSASFVEKSDFDDFSEENFDELKQMRNDSIVAEEFNKVIVCDEVESPNRLSFGRQSRPRKNSYQNHNDSLKFNISLSNL
ncbi:hypothetical protein SteCoe_6834 [Stentor coeruleus]|uniref:Uncharacterized protein n=1 Tax=Stentor coeruleus TaxID=5963 RepID=A0A1R2CP17_9CILI|nr:hypothetical protein SteCoe_6834 [Stentor coeruleus]